MEPSASDIKLFVPKILLIALLSFPKFVFAEDSPEQKFWKLYLEKATPIVKSIQALEEKKSRVVNTYFEYNQQIDEINKLSKKLKDKKLSEGDRSIIEKQINDAEAKAEKSWSEFTENYQFVALELSDAIDLRREKVKSKSKDNILTRIVLEEEYDALVNRRAFKYTHNLLHLIDSRCVTDQKFNTECLKTWISTCAVTFSTAEKKLAYESIDNQLRLNLTPSDSPSEMFKELWAEVAPPQWYQDGISAGTYGCLFIAAQGYQFQKQKVFFENFNGPDWLASLRERENYTLVKIANICPPEPSAIQIRGKELMANPRVAEDVKKVSLPSYLKGVSFCEMFVKKTCENLHQVSADELAYNYSTVGCETRSVTAKDVAKDVENFKEGSSTDADIKKHESLAEIIESCSIVQKKGYDWKFVKAVVSKDCKKRSK